jgi:ergothioneine biosynthesis protein EgtB
MTTATPTIQQQAEQLANRFRSIRRFTEDLAAPLSPEDCGLQSMPDASPTKWHLAHTTWFFETFLLRKLPDYQVFDSSYAYLFNSYYNLIGEQFPRSKRGLVSRPDLDEILEYRRHVDLRMLQWLSAFDNSLEDVLHVVEVGLQHEQQHQELILTDIKHALSQSPLNPVYLQGTSGDASASRRSEWLSFEEGIYWTGHNSEGFCFDNELPRHRVFLDAFRLSDQLVNCADYLKFVRDGGYKRPELWLSLGWQAVCEHRWHAPLYWHEVNGEWREFTLSGMREIEMANPVCHVSYFEADAYARWANARLPTEAEWEVASADSTSAGGNFVESLLAERLTIHPQIGNRSSGHPANMFGDVWEWTSSPYECYPGYEAPAGALGEYNGKFMCNQFVLRGGSCATSATHIRRSYRNFFPPETRWQFAGIRLAERQ